MTDSATGGYLLPVETPTPPDYDTLFDIFLQGVVAGILTMPGKYVRPRWQLNPPKRPPMETTWAAIGVQHISAGNPESRHDGAANGGKGQNNFTTYEDVDVLVTFYGPCAWRAAALFRDGLWMSQNREALYLAGCGVGDIGGIQSNSELINNQWLNRVDMTVRFVRDVKRVYQVLNLLSAKGTINASDGSQLMLAQPWNTENYHA